MRLIHLVVEPEDKSHVNARVSPPGVRAASRGHRSLAYMLSSLVAGSPGSTLTTGTACPSGTRWYPGYQPGFLRMADSKAGSGGPWALTALPAD